MVSKILLALVLCSAIVVVPVWCQGGGSAATATVLQRLRQNFISAAESPEVPSLEGHVDGCVRTPVPAPMVTPKRKKFGFSFSVVNAAKQEQGGILYKNGIRTPQVLQIFSGSEATPEEAQPAPVTNKPQTFMVHPEDNEWPVPKFPGCAMPSCVASTIAWKSQAIQDAKREVFDLIMADRGASQIFSNLLKLGRDYNSTKDNTKICLSFDFNFGNFKVNYLGFDKVSDDMQCISHPSGNFIFDCVSKSGKAVSAHGIRSDKTSYILFFMCWESGEQTWTLFRSSGSDFKFTADMKWDALRTVESLGFNACDYEIFDRTHCLRY